MLGKAAGTEGLVATGRGPAGDRHLLWRLPLGQGVLSRVSWQLKDDHCRDETLVFEIGICAYLSSSFMQVVPEQRYDKVVKSEVPTSGGSYSVSLASRRSDTLYSVTTFVEHHPTAF